jgi:hypothetical protein
MRISLNRAEPGPTLEVLRHNRAKGEGCERGPDGVGTVVFSLSNNFLSKSLLLLTCLLIVTRLRAQNDTTAPPPAAAPAQVQDTTVRAVTHPVRTLSHRDSIAGLAQDTVVKAAPDTAARKDSTKLRDSLALRAAANHPPPVPADTGPPVEIHQPNSKDSLFYLIVAILFYFASIRIFFEKYFNNLLTLFFRVSLRQQQIREQVLQTPLPSLLLNILFVISAGLYACFLLHYSRWGAGVRFWILYLNCMALLAAIYLVKFVVLKFIGWVFSISRATDIYIFIVFLVNKMLGIFLLPFLIVIIFSGQEGREVFITISLAMVFVLWGYRVLASYRPVRNEIKLTPFYFLLYLCAFEIAPLLLIYKVLLTYLEKVY